jgi:hypothetical protein
MTRAQLGVGNHVVVHVAEVTIDSHLTAILGKAQPSKHVSLRAAQTVHCALHS